MSSAQPPGEPKWQPDFVIIGAVKAATTWIQARLQENPAIYMPDPEPHFFSTEFASGPLHYRSYFRNIPSGVTHIGEKSADYLAHPEAPARLARMLPQARLVLQLRDPVERAYSDYKMFYRRGTIDGPPEDYLCDPQGPYPRFLEDGLYARHLARWLDVFPREQILVYLYEDLAIRPREIVAEVSRHIGVEPFFSPGAARARENSSRASVLPLPLRRALRPFKEAVRPWRGNPIFESARALVARKIRYPALSQSLRAHLSEYYASDTQTLQRLIGQPLHSWQGSHAPATAKPPVSGPILGRPAPKWVWRGSNSGGA
ncbi:sulfotransferase [Novosphingobium profundi]|uniref:sulfotransferase family protein n=1 Tax=Novosphingobium profundi TaxID=1774954 RepID=UPI001BDA58E6|nr:sulfotransferase [Novosphingobium profundi]MBT0667224.1 sulfotransferase [Novosphingobium profundi]